MKERSEKKKMNHELERIKRIKAEMGINGDTKVKISKVLKCSRNTAHKKLTGKSQFTLSELERLAEYYGKPRDYFF